MPWSSSDPELLLTRAQSGPKLHTPHLKARIPSGRGSCHSTLPRHTPTHRGETLNSRNNSLGSCPSPGLYEATVRGFQPEQKQHPPCLGVMVFLLSDEILAGAGCNGKPHLLQNHCQLYLPFPCFCFSLLTSQISSFFLASRVLFKVNQGQCVFLLQLITCFLACD